MTESKGRWSHGCGWHWQSPVKTEKVLDSLVPRGLVSKVGEHLGYAVYEVTQEGLKAFGERKEFA